MAVANDGSAACNVGRLMVMKQVAPPKASGVKTSSELATRIVSAIVMIAAALATACIGGGLFAIFWAVAAVAIFWEWTRMAGVAAYIPRPYLVATAAVALIALAGIPHLPPGGGEMAVGVAAVFVCLTVILCRNARDRMWVAGGVGYAAVIAFFPPFLREMPLRGLSNILWVFSVVWATDIAAYFVGRTFGGPKLWPRVSPNKTWSGFCGGLVAGTLAGVAIVVFLQKGGAYLPWMLVALFSCIASVLSQGGDLAESSLKRHFGVKDSSFLIPGHGGVMDRLDGFWAAVFFLGMCLILTHLAHGGTM